MSPAGLKLLEDMRKSRANWKKRDLETLYLGFGFNIRHGSSHDIVVHPLFRELRTTLPRHGEVLKSYVAEAVKMIDRLQALRRETENAARSKGTSQNPG